MEAVRAEVGAARFTSGRFADAVALFSKLIFSTSFEEFLTLPAYDLLPS
jgi:malate synthase